MAIMHSENETHGLSEIHRPLRPVPRCVRKLVVIVDGSHESKVAMRFAAARASHITGGGLILFHCVRPGEFQHWMAVADRMREEAQDEAHDLLDAEAAWIKDYSGVTAEIAIKEGDPREELLRFICGREDVFGLVLGAGPSGEPGTIVDYFTHEKVGELPCPVMLVPSDMSDEKIDTMA